MASSSSSSSSSSPAKKGWGLFRRRKKNVGDKLATSGDGVHSNPPLDPLPRCPEPVSLAIQQEVSNENASGNGERIGPNQWSCERCTFINENLNPHACSMCGYLRTEGNERAQTPTYAFTESLEGTAASQTLSERVYTTLTQRKHTSLSFCAGRRLARTAACLHRNRAFVVMMLVVFCYMAFSGGFQSDRPERTYGRSGGSNNDDEFHESDDEFDALYGEGSEGNSTFDHLVLFFGKMGDDESFDPFTHPTIVKTNIRLIMANFSEASRHIFESSFHSSSYSVVSLLKFLSVTILVIASASIMQRLSPRFMRTLWNFQEWGKAVFFTSCFFLVLEDLLKNYFPHALWGGLHFSTFGMFLLDVGCLGGVKGSLDNALGIPSTLTAKQKLGSGVSACSFFLGFPIAVEALLRAHNMPVNLMWTCFWTSSWRYFGMVVHMVSSSLLFFGGLHFFGKSLMGWLRFAPLICTVSYLPVRVLRIVLDHFQQLLVSCMKEFARSYSIVIPAAIVNFFVQMMPGIRPLDTCANAPWHCIYIVHYFTACPVMLAWCFGWVFFLMHQESQTTHRLQRYEYLMGQMIAAQLFLDDLCLFPLVVAGNKEHFERRMLLAIIVGLTSIFMVQEVAIQFDFVPLSKIFDNNVTPIVESVKRALLFLIRQVIKILQISIEVFHKYAARAWKVLKRCVQNSVDLFVNIIDLSSRLITLLVDWFARWVLSPAIEVTRLTAEKIGTLAQRITDNVCSNILDPLKKFMLFNARVLLAGVKTFVKLCLLMIDEACTVASWISEMMSAIFYHLRRIACAIFDIMQKIGTAIYVFAFEVLRMLYDTSLRVLSQVENVLSAIGSVVWIGAIQILEVFSTVCRMIWIEVIKVASIVWGVLIKICRIIGTKMDECASTIWGLLENIAHAAWHIIRKIWRIVVHFCRFVWTQVRKAVEMIQGVLEKAGRAVWRVVTHICRWVWTQVRKVTEVIWDVLEKARRSIIWVLEKVGNAMWDVLVCSANFLLHVGEWVANEILSPISKKYWRLLPACVAMMGAILLVKIFVLHTFVVPKHKLELVSNIGFFLGSYAMGLISVVLMKSVFYSGRNLVRLSPTIEVSQSLLKYADLFLVDFLVWAIQNASHLLAEICRMLFKILGQTASQLLTVGLSTLKKIWFLIFSPIWSLLKRSVTVVWDNPFFFFVPSLTILALIYMNEKGYISTFGWILSFFDRYYYGLLEDLKIVSRESASHTKNSIDFLLKEAWGVFDFLVPMFQGTGEAVRVQSNSVVKALEAPTAENPHLAWFSYVFLVSLSKTQAQVKVKHLGIPIMTLPLCYFFPTIAKWSFPAFLLIICWILVSTFLVSPYQMRQLDEVTPAFRQYQQVRKVMAQKPSERLRELVETGKVPNFDQRECIVCMECFKKDDEVTVLPCGHNFHASCIGQWLDKPNAKCPVCRAAVGGVDRLLEVLF